MNLRLFLGSFLAALALTLWGFLFWALVYEPLDLYHSLPDGDAVASVLVEQETATGTYFYPWPRNSPEAMEAFVEQHRKGPFFKLSFIREGVDPQNPAKIVRGFLLNFLVSLFAGLILVLASVQATSRGRRFWKQTAVVCLAGFIGTFFIQLGDPLWFDLPWDYVRGILVYEGGSWLTMGMVLASMIREKK